MNTITNELDFASLTLPTKQLEQRLERLDRLERELESPLDILGGAFEQYAQSVREYTWG